MSDVLRHRWVGWSEDSRCLWPLPLALPPPVLLISLAPQVMSYINVVPLLGAHFNLYFPLVLLLWSTVTFFGLWARLVAKCPCSKRMKVSRRARDFCHFTGIPSASLLKHLLKKEVVQQNDSLADGE